MTDIISELVNITKSSDQSQLPQDISVAVDVLESIISRYGLPYHVLVNM